MAVKLIKKSASAAQSKAATPVKGKKTGQPLPPVVKKSHMPDIEVKRGKFGRPDIGRTVKIGKSSILPDIDVHDVLGGCKFIAHLHKPGIWYKISGYDETDQSLRLISRSGVCFDSSLHRTVAKNYMVIMEADITATEPSKEALEFVATLVGLLPEAPPWEEEMPKWETPPPPKVDEPPAKKGKIVLKTKAQVQADKEFDNPHHGHPPEEPEAPVAKKGHINFTVKKKTEEPLPVKKGKINFTVKKKS